MKNIIVVLALMLFTVFNTLAQSQYHGNFTGGNVNANNLGLNDGSVSNYYQLPSLIPPQTLSTLDNYWTNNPLTSYFNPVIGVDATAALGDPTHPSLTLTNAIAISPTNNGCIYWQVPTGGGWTPNAFQLFKSLTWVGNGGWIYQQIQSINGIKFNYGPNFFYDMYESNIVFDPVGSNIVSENYCFHDNRNTVDIYQLAGNVQANNSIYLTRFDSFHRIPLLYMYNCNVYANGPGSQSCTCIREGIDGYGFFAQNCILDAWGAGGFSGANGNVAVGIEAGNGVGVLKNCQFYCGTNYISQAVNTIICEGSNSVIFLDHCVGIATNMIYSDGLGVVTTASSYTLTNAYLTIGVLYTNNSITQTKLDGTIYLTNAAAGDAIVEFTNLTKQTSIFAQMPSALVSGSSSIPFSATIGQGSVPTSNNGIGDIVEFLNVSTGSGASVGIRVCPTLICP